VPSLQCVFPGCGAPAEIQYRLSAFDVVSCSRCGLKFRQPFPTAEEIAQMYNDPVYLASSYFSGQGPDATIKAHPEISIYRQGLDWLNACSTAQSKQHRLLDVGCGTGFFLDCAKRDGWDVEGVEISRKHAEKAQREFQVPVHCADFSALFLEPASFDAITLWDLLEHAKEPWKVLEQARRLLRQNGKLVVFTINSASLFNELAHLGYRLAPGGLRRAMELLYDKRHNYYFDERSLKAQLERSGFAIEAHLYHRAHLKRWLAEPAPGWVLGLSECVDWLSVPLNMQYRQLLFCS